MAWGRQLDLYSYLKIKDTLMSSNYCGMILFAWTLGTKAFRFQALSSQKTAQAVREPEAVKELWRRSMSAGTAQMLHADRKEDL